MSESEGALLDVSVIIPTLNAARQLPTTLAACAGALEIIIVDGGSADETVATATRSGARVVVGPRGRGIQLHQGALQARGQWLLFLHADTVLSDEWRAAVRAFIALASSQERAATFRFSLDDPSQRARHLERAVAWRVRTLGLPYGDQGLLIHRAFYRALGGYRALPLMEDVELVRRIGRRRLSVLSASARTSAERWQRDGWYRRSARNLGCLTLYFLGVSPRLLVKLYGR
ncbi:MAG: TIGR04283 family arsenosugar biosynthesis glycosyltransferase [Steroidobacteraceae bacterium]